MSIRTVQEIFNLAISTGYYSFTKVECRFMCHALKEMYYDSIISEDECWQASTAIDEYMCELSGMSTAKHMPLSSILQSRFGHYPTDRSLIYRVNRYIYSNWEYRPLAYTEYSTIHLGMYSQDSRVQE